MRYFAIAPTDRRWPVQKGRRSERMTNPGHTICGFFNCLGLGDGLPVAGWNAGGVVVGLRALQQCLGTLWRPARHRWSANLICTRPLPSVFLKLRLATRSGRQLNAD